MTQTTLTLELSEELARAAAAAGLLTPEAVTRLLQSEMMNALSNGDDPPLANDELNAEIAAARAERRASRAGGT